MDPNNNLAEQLQLAKRFLAIADRAVDTPIFDPNEVERLAELVVAAVKENGPSQKDPTTMTNNDVYKNICSYIGPHLGKFGTEQRAEIVQSLATIANAVVIVKNNGPWPTSEEKPDSHAGLSAEQILEACDANEGCIDDMACPKCGHYEGFEIMVTQSAMTFVHDEGTDFDGSDSEWSDTSDCRCPECDHLATVGDFRLSDVALARADAFLATTE